MARIKQLKDPFTDEITYPVTVLNAVYSEDGKTINELLDNKVEGGKLNDVDLPIVDKKIIIPSVTATDTSITIINNSVAVKLDKTNEGNVKFQVTPDGIKATVDIMEFIAIVVDALPAEGENSTYYLVPTENPTVFTKYLWAIITQPDTFGYVNLGTTEIDLSGYVQKTELSGEIETFIASNYTPVDMLVEYTDGTSETFKVLTQNP